MTNNVIKIDSIPSEAWMFFMESHVELTSSIKQYEEGCISISDLIAINNESL